MKASEWIDRVKKQHGWDSDYRAAKELGLSRNAISNYRGGRTPTMDEETSIKVAHALDVPVESVLVDQLMERTKDNEVRSAWQRVMQGLSGVAAGLLVACGLIGSPAPSHASTASVSSPLYIMSNNKRAKVTLAADGSMNRSCNALHLDGVRDSHAGAMPADFCPLTWALVRVSALSGIRVNEALVHRPLVGGGFC